MMYMLFEWDIQFKIVNRSNAVETIFKHIKEENSC